MICLEKGLLLFIVTASLVYNIDAFQIQHTSIDPNNPVQVGSTVRLSCKTDGHYEYCIWRHKTRVCKFEWKYSSGTVQQTECNELKDRTIFKGSYNNYECAMELKNVQISDHGDWSCEMEKYVLGSLRGSTHKKVLRLNVVPKIYPSSTATLYSTNRPTETTTQTTASSTASSVITTDVELTSEKNYMNINTTKDVNSMVAIITPRSQTYNDTLGSYWITEDGENCPAEHVVLDEPSCRDAAVELGKQYSAGYYDESKWPAGCFTVSSVFFNHKIDPSSTTPHSQSAGICRSVPAVDTKPPTERSTPPRTDATTNPPSGSEPYCKYTTGSCKEDRTDYCCDCSCTECGSLEYCLNDSPFMARCGVCGAGYTGCGAYVRECDEGCSHCYPHQNARSGTCRRSSSEVTKCVDLSGSYYCSNSPSTYKGPCFYSGTSSSASIAAITTPPGRTVALMTSAGTEYISKPNKYCEDSKKIAEYSTLQLAQQACTANAACKAVTDYQCNGGFWTCENPNLIYSSSGSCSWLKGTSSSATIAGTTSPPGRTVALTTSAGSFVNNFNEYDYNTLDYDGDGGNEFDGSGEFEDIESGRSGILTSTSATELQTTETIQSTQANILVLQSSSCRDQKIWCNLADCSLENVKQNCKKTCNIC